MDIKTKLFTFIEAADKFNEFPELINTLKVGYAKLEEITAEKSLIESTVSLLEQEMSPDELDELTKLPIDVKILKLKEIAKILGSKGVGDLMYRYMNTPIVKAYKTGLTPDQILDATAT